MSRINKKRVTLKFLAERLGLSVTTISRVLNGKASHYRISEETETLVMQEAKKLNFYPNQLARGLRTNKTLAIGLIIPDISLHISHAASRLKLANAVMLSSSVTARRTQILRSSRLSFSKAEMWMD